MGDSRKPPRRASQRPSRAPTAPPRVQLGSMVKPADVASLARSLLILRQRLADTEATLARERSERAADADTIAEMLVRIVSLERSLKAAAAADARARSIAPPAVDPAALQRLAALEARVDAAEARARTADARAADADARARAESERAATIRRDADALRTKLADAEVRARVAEDRVEQAEQAARAARSHAAQLSEQIDFNAELEQERVRHKREVDELRARNAVALRDAHAAYEEAFRSTLEDERGRMSGEVEEERERVRVLEARVAELTDALRSNEAKHEAVAAQLRAEIAALAFDRDAADRQRSLSAMQLHAAEAKLELVDKQLEWAEEAIAIVNGAFGEHADEQLRSAVATLIERLDSARGALFTESASLRPPPLPCAGDSKGEPE